MHETRKVKRIFSFYRLWFMIQWTKFPNISLRYKLPYLYVCSRRRWTIFVSFSPSKLAKSHAVIQIVIHTYRSICLMHIIESEKRSRRAKAHCWRTMGKLEWGITLPNYSIEPSLRCRLSLGSGGIWDQKFMLINVNFLVPKPKPCWSKFSVRLKNIG